jgi:hypothetical protein
MLEIGIHDGNVRGPRRHHAFDARGRESATPNALDSSHLTIPGGKVSQQIRGTIGGMIVDEYCFPNNAFKGFPQRLQEERNIFCFIVSGNYDRQFERKVLSGYRRIECRSLSVLRFEGGVHNFTQSLGICAKTADEWGWHNLTEIEAKVKLELLWLL